MAEKLDGLAWTAAQDVTPKHPKPRQACVGCAHLKDGHLHKHCDTCARRFQDHYKEGH